ncbi:MAG: HAMP domain-containing histidine kinase [Myxococcales bacterium]|nr:HAMP domain-containing histidine kinase [Myxococcales bacterium]
MVQGADDLESGGSSDPIASTPEARPLYRSSYPPPPSRPTASAPFNSAPRSSEPPTSTVDGRRRLSRIPFLPFVPAVVLLLSAIVAFSIVAIGVSELKRQSDEAASLRARILSQTLAARIRATSSDDRQHVIERAASRSGAELLLVTQDGYVRVDGSLGAPSSESLIGLLIEGEGETQTQMGRVRFSATPLGAPLGDLVLVSFVRAPETPYATGSLISSVAFLTALLVGIALAVGYALARDVVQDVEFTGARVAEMAIFGAEPSGRLIPVRSADQVGLLTSAFNVLVERFAAAEHAYRQDLATAQAHDRDRSAFLAALSHELRTPLNAVLGFADVLLAEVDGPLSEEARENLEIVRKSGDHLRALIDDILDLSGLESGEFQLSRGNVDLFNVASQVVREARATISNKPVELRLIGGSSSVWADERRLRQIIGNLVGNAVKFTREGFVEVAVEAHADVSRLTVLDTGPGIAPDMQSAIFEEFQQAGDLRTRRAGSGLGLAITRRLVAMHGGVIELESRLGEGSRFTVTLPASSELAPRSAPLHEVPE